MLINKAGNAVSTLFSVLTVKPRIHAFVVTRHAQIERHLNKVLHSCSPELISGGLFQSNKNYSILHMKCWAAFGLALAPIVDAGGGDIGVPDPRLHHGDVRFKEDRAESLRRILADVRSLPSSEFRQAITCARVTPRTCVGSCSPVRLE